MPASLLSDLVRWAASHLVLFSLFGFVFAGLVVFGVIRIPDAWVAPFAASTPAEPAPWSPGPVSRHAAPVSDAGAVERPTAPQVGASSGPTGEAKAPLRMPPKLIGGSLPVYDPARFGTPLGDPFRPARELPVPTSVVPTRDDLVQQARRAFWNGDLEAAESGYMDLVAAYPDDADAFGELGNLYQSMGKPAEALDAYYEAGMRLRAHGETEKLGQVIEILTKEGDPRVDRLAP